MTRLSLSLSLLLIMPPSLSAQWILADEDWEAAVSGFLEHQGVLYDQEDRAPAIWRSTDDGFHWVPSDSGLLSHPFIRLLGDTDSVLFAVDEYGAHYRSTSGSSWTLMNHPGRMNSFAHIGTHAFAGTGTGCWHSTDGGETWAPAPDFPLPGNSCMVRSYGTTLYVGTSSALFRSTDGGHNWGTLPVGSAGTHVNSWAMDGDIFAAINSGLHVSTDAGMTWHIIDTLFHRAVVVTGTSLFVGDSGPVVRYSPNFGLTWRDVSANLGDFHWYLYGEPSVLSLIAHHGYLILGTAKTSIYLRPLAEMVKQPLTVQISAFRFRDGTLEWTTLSEVDNYGFFVQFRSEHDPVFVDVEGAFVPGNQTTTAPHFYRYLIAGSAGYYRLRQVDLDGTLHYSDEILVTRDQLTAAGAADKPRGTFCLWQNYPNPFNPTTTIYYQLPVACKVTLRVYDILGREVETLVQQEEEAGYRDVRFNAGSRASGVYFCRLAAEPSTGGIAYTSVTKMIFMK